MPHPDLDIPFLEKQLSNIKASASVIGIPIFHDGEKPGEEYTAFVYNYLGFNPIKHPNYDEFEKIKNEQEAKFNNSEIIHILITPEPFLAWCKANDYRASIESVFVYARWVAPKMVKYFFPRKPVELCLPYWQPGEDVYKS